MVKGSEQKLSEFEERKAAYDAEIQSLTRMRDQLKNELLSLQEKCFEIENKNHCIMIERGQMRSKIEELFKEKAQASFEIDQLVADKNTLNNQIVDLKEKLKEAQERLIENEKTMKDMMAAKNTISLMIPKETNIRVPLANREITGRPSLQINNKPTSIITSGAGSLMSATSKIMDMKRDLDMKTREVIELRRCIENRNIEIDILRKQAKMVEIEFEKAKKIIAENPLTKKVVALETEIILAKSSALEKRQPSTFESKHRSQGSCMTELTQDQIDNNNNVENERNSLHLEIQELVSKNTSLSKRLKSVQQQFEAEESSAKSYKIKYIDLETALIVERNKVSDLRLSLVLTVLRVSELSNSSVAECVEIVKNGLGRYNHVYSREEFEKVISLVEIYSDGKVVSDESLILNLSEILPDLPWEIIPAFKVIFQPFLDANKKGD